MKVKDIIKSNIACSKGEKVKKHIIKALNKNEVIELDFEGIDTAISAFFNVCIGDLHKNYSEEQISLIRFKNINENIYELIEIIKETAKRYYEN